MEDGAFITWQQLQTFSGQVVALTALTALLFRVMRAALPDTPDAVVQAIAVILSTATALLTSYSPDVARYQWLTLGVFNGVLTGQIVIKSLDWAVTAKTATGVPKVPTAAKEPT